MEKLISIDLKGDFGFFRKPDTNNTVNLSYNIIHKPAILGILGAVVGLGGYKEKGKWPEYYEAFKNLKIGVQPLSHDKGNYIKTNIKYSNTVGYANKGSNFLTEEMTLVKPEYRIFILLDSKEELQKKLIENLSKSFSEFIPYFGKNEFTAWWEKESYQEYEFEKCDSMPDSVQLQTLFKRDNIVKDNSEAPYPDILNFENIEVPFMYFERLPQGFDTDLFQYDMAEFVYATYNIKNGMNLKNVYHLKKEDWYVQLL
jgi:CRISPR-associated protein Cas5h